MAHRLDRSSRDGDLLGATLRHRHRRRGVGPGESRLDRAYRPIRRKQARGLSGAAMRLESLLEKTAETAPDREALVAGDRRLSFGALEAESNRLAHALRRLGVHRGDRVAIHLDNCVETVTSLFAALKAGACFMMVSPTTKPKKPKKLDYLLDHARARLLVLPAAKLAMLGGDLSERQYLEAIVAVGPAARTVVPRKSVIAYDEATAPGSAPDSPPGKRCIDLDLAAILYTSGSTGDPKGVMLTHRNVVSATES